MDTMSAILVKKPATVQGHRIMATLKKHARHAPDRLISGKLRTKAARRGASHTTVSIDGTDYAWSYRHGWQVWGKGIQAISLSVSLRPGRTRELILDFTLK